MAPKNRFTKEEIIEQALAVVRTNGVSGLTARSVAAKLGSSPKPIFGLFAGMEALSAEAMSAAYNIYQHHVQAAMQSEKYPPYKAAGMAYISFAQEEKELFKWLFMRDRSKEEIQENRELLRPILNEIMKNTGMSEDSAYQFHMQLWICVHGIATMAATGFLNWDTEFVSNTLTSIYEGVKKQWTQSQQ